MPILACGTVVPPLDSSDFPLQSWCLTAEMLMKVRLMLCGETNDTKKIIDVTTSVGNKTQNVSPFSLGVAKIENVFFERCCFWRASDRQMLY